jgi:hypothetical protein
VVEDPARLDDVIAVGVDGTAYLRATGAHPTEFATGIADLSPGRTARLLDVVCGRSGTVSGSRTWPQPLICRFRPCVRTR